MFYCTICCCFHHTPPPPTNKKQKQLYIGVCLPTQATTSKPAITSLPLFGLGHCFGYIPKTDGCHFSVGAPQKWGLVTLQLPVTRWVTSDDKLHHKLMHFSKLVSCKPFLKSNHKLNPCTNTKHTHQIFKRQVSSILPLLKKYKARTSWNHLTILIFGYQTMEIWTILQFILSTICLSNLLYSTAIFTQ